MLDKSTSALLDIINENCKEGEYKIFAEEDFSPVLEEGKTPLSETLSALCEQGYIAVKYSGGGMYCVRPLNKAREYCKVEEERIKAEKRNLYAHERSAFYGGFAGGFLSSVLFSLCFLLLFFLLKR